MKSNTGEERLLIASFSSQPKPNHVILSPQVCRLSQALLSWLDLSQLEMKLHFLVKFFGAKAQPRRRHKVSP